MTYRPHYDRADWRALSTRTLIEAARDCPNELAIVLGERLDELEGLEDRAYDLEKEVLDLQARLDAMEQTIEEHEAALGYDQ